MHPWFRFIAHSLSALLILSASCSTSPSGPDAAMPLPPKPASNKAGYHLQNGDAIDVFVIEDSSFNGEFVIRPSGDIIMPKVGRVPLQGLSLSEAEARLKQILQSSQLREATVIVDPGTRGVVAGGGVTVRMSGEIGHTGRVTLQPLTNGPISAWQAVVDSGGFGPFAHKRKSYILRNSPSGVVRINVDFEAVEAGKAPDPPIVEGDCIVVPKKIFGL